MNKNIILAYNEAIEAMKKWDYPVWAVMFTDNGIMIAGRNERNTKADKKSHAEINLIETAKKYVIQIRYSMLLWNLVKCVRVHFWTSELPRFIIYLKTL